MPAENPELRFSREVPPISVEIEPTKEGDKLIIPFAVLQADLQQNYTEHLRKVEEASFNVLDGVVRSARTGFHISLVLNISSFILGAGIIVTGLVMLVKSPEDFGKVVGVVSSLLGILLVIALLFWKGPLDRILESVSNLARINVITIGLAHRLNQISRVFVQESLKGSMDLQSLNSLNEMINNAVHNSVQEFQVLLPKESAEEQARKIMVGFGGATSGLSKTTHSKLKAQEDENKPSL